MSGPVEYHDCRYGIFWPSQIRFFSFTNKSVSQHEQYCKWSFSNFRAFPNLMQVWNDLENKGVSIKRRLPLLLAPYLHVSLLPFACCLLIAFLAAKDTIKYNAEPKTRGFLLEFYPYLICSKLKLPGNTKYPVSRKRSPSPQSVE